MMRFAVLALTVSLAYGYGSPAFGFGGGLGLKSGGYGAPLGFAGGYARHLNHGPIPAAIQSTRTYEVIPVALNYEAPVEQFIEVGPNIQPVNILFRTQSSPLNLQQVHTPATPQYESTRSEDAPSVLTHENYKPVIQEYKEVIQPYRRIEQRVQPVIENVHTVVAKGEEYRAPVALPAPAFAAPATFAAPAAFAAPAYGGFRSAQLPLLAKAHYK